MWRTAKLALAAATLAAAACAQPQADEHASSPHNTVVQTGADVLASQNFASLAGQRVGLITHAASMVDSTHVIDLFAGSADVELTTLFGLEHGLRGGAAAGEAIGDGTDDATGLPVVSLYGARRRPETVHLQNIDVLVFDVQDVGARFYTYISSMGLAMQSAAEAGIPFVVLDRPNPLGGEYTAGFVLEPGHESFVGMYPIPVAHGMTIGELARMIAGEQLLDGLDDLQLDVVTMAGWSRSTLWPATGLDWIPPSPNIPDFTTALIYPGTCFFEATTATEGRGTDTPFLLLGLPNLDADSVAKRVTSANLPGVTIMPTRFATRSIPGVAPNPKHLGIEIPGVRITVTDPPAYLPLETGMHLLTAFVEDAGPEILRMRGMARLAGGNRLYSMLTDGASAEDVIGAWADEVAAFRERREPYLLYD